MKFHTKSTTFLLILSNFGFFTAANDSLKSSAREALDGIASYPFATYVSDFNKSYDPETDEWKKRNGIARDNLKEILTHNSRFYNKETTYLKGINKFLDQMPHERNNGYDKSRHPAYSGNNSHDSSMAVMRRLYQDLPHDQLPFEIDEIEFLPTNVDWRTKGIVSPVKDQGACGSCWAFASTEVIESNVAMETGRLLDLSPQQLVSCTPNLEHCGGAGGCTGATVEVAFDYVIQAGGMVLNEDIEYTASNGVCPLQLSEPISPNAKSLRGLNTNVEASQKIAGITDYVTLPTNDYNAVMNAVAKTGPVAVAVDASEWYLYSSGIFDGSGDGSFSYDIDHAVVLVGYGTDEELGMDYWLVRNSWGPEWGEDGYIRLKRDGKLIDCAMDITPFDGSGCQLDEAGNQIPPQPVKVCGIDGILFDVVVPLGGHLVY